MRRTGVIFFILAVVAAVPILIWATWPAAKFDFNETNAVIATGCVAALVAIWAIFSQRAITRRQTTLEHIAALQSDGDLIRGRMVFRKLARTNGALAELATPEKEDSEDYQAVTTRLNEFELVSIGIQRGIIDAELYCKWYKSGTVRAWHDALPFVSALRLRHNNQALFKEFEKMVQHFESGDHPPIIWWWGRIF